MSMASVAIKPRVVIETTGGQVYDLPVYDLEGRPAPINLQPIDPFDQVSVVGDTAKALDRRVDRIVPSDQSGGAGRRKYTETEGVTDYRQSDADTRHRGVIVCRPKRVTLAGTINITDEGQRVEYTYYAGALHHTYHLGGPLYYHTGAAWAATVPALSIMRGYAKGAGYTWVMNGLGFLYRSTDGINFTNVNTPFGGDVGYGLCYFDNKLFTVRANGGTLAFELIAYVTLAGAAPIPATVVASFSWVGGEEYPVDLFAWKDASGSPALFIITTRRILAYNPVGGTMEEYDNFGPENAGSSPFLEAGLTALVFRSTGDLYTAQGYHADYLMRYSPGAGFGKVTPNRYGGLENAFQGSPRVLAQNAYGMGVWTSETSVVGGTATSKGVAWFMDAQGGWHCMNRDLAQTVPIEGGGIGNRTFYTVFNPSGVNNSYVEMQDLPSTGNLPQFAVGRKYDINTDHVHEYARTDFGTEGTRFALLGFDLLSYLSDGSDQPGLDTNASLKVEYQLDGGSWVVVEQYKDSAGTIRTNAGGVFTPATTGIDFPLRLVINDEFGVSGYDLAWRVTLRTSDEDETPVLVYCAPRAKKTPPPHYSYEFVVDVMDLANQSSMARGGVMGLPSGLSAGGIHDSLQVLDQLGNMVKITYGIGRQQVTDVCEFAMAPQLHPVAGEGRYRISLRSVATDPSG